jgi:uncharacterized membrane protein YecN with MAPEG domain
MTLPIISSYAAAILGIFQIALMLTVGLRRGAKKISLGDGGDEILHYRIRRHGNLTENAPLFLVVLGFLEVSGGPSLAVLSFAAIFIVARFSHAYGMSGPDSPLPPRAIGAFGTLIGIVGTSVTLLWHLSTTSV